MIKNPEVLKKLEDNLIRGEGNLSFEKTAKLFASMWNEGVRLGVLPPKEPLEGIEVDIRIAKVLNSCLKRPSPG
ncbi:hypothetical protein BMS3Bbin07_00667 [bacterium BMS3Bbin07]|nr:hypothetical protein BMS3Bbin07_00667 [bacterium BMS3Bbin07]GMT48335.1 MAG: hypothetical protein IEMM0007_1901 [bacterium]